MVKRLRASRTTRARGSVLQGGSDNGIQRWHTSRRIRLFGGLVVAFLVCASVVRRSRSINQVINFSSDNHDEQEVFDFSKQYVEFLPGDFPETKGNTTELLPVQVMEQYIRQHSVHALRRELHTNSGRNENNDKADHHRLYAVAYYSCPQQAGNRLHHFFNNLLWSIYTNRTVLWKYWDRETCQKYGALYSPLICQKANRVENCDAILRRYPWIASYDEWSDKLNLPEPTELSVWSMYPKRQWFATDFMKVPWENGGDNPSENHTGVDTKTHLKVVSFPVSPIKQVHLKSSVDIRNRLLQTEHGRQTCERLYSRGANFLYGMLFHYSFAMTKKVLEGVPSTNSTAVDTPQCSIAVHSRHTAESNDGHNIYQETKCLRRMLPNTDDSDATKSSCEVYIMSDRAKTLSGLQKWLTNTSVEHGESGKIKHTALAINHSAAPAATGKNSMFLVEHGPFSGAGFFKDLALASRATTGFVGHSRTSSDIVLEQIEFNRITKASQEGRVIPEPVAFCILPG